jgi:hypothetical protein
MSPGMRLKPFRRSEPERSANAAADRAAASGGRNKHAGKHHRYAEFHFRGGMSIASRQAASRAGRGTIRDGRAAREVMSARGHWRRHRRSLLSARGAADSRTVGRCADEAQRIRHLSARPGISAWHSEFWTVEETVPTRLLDTSACNRGAGPALYPSRWSRAWSSWWA